MESLRIPRRSCTSWNPGAIELNPKSDVAYYQLAQAYRPLGDASAQEKALATFRQLRSLPSPAATPGSPRPEVTKQTLDPDKPVR